jgi:hypothetical protein
MYGPDQYLAIVVGLMFLFGIALIIQSARQRSVIRQRWDHVPQGQETTAKTLGKGSL